MLRRVSDHKSSRRWVDIAFAAQMIANVVALALVIGLLFQVNARQLDQIKRQNEATQQQNITQLCAQHDITIAVRKIGLKLGLPVADIVPPTTEGLDCPKVNTP